MFDSLVRASLQLAAANSVFHPVCRRVLLKMRFLEIVDALFQSGPESASLHAECSTSTATAHAAASDEEHLLLKKPKLELSPQTPHDDHGDRGGQVDNNNVSPGSAFRPWNADEEGGSAAHPGHEGLHNGDVAERKLDPYLLRGNGKASKVANTCDVCKFF